MKRMNVYKAYCSEKAELQQYRSKHRAIQDNKMPHIKCQMKHCEYKILPEIFHVIWDK